MLNRENPGSGKNDLLCQVVCRRRWGKRPETAVGQKTVQPIKKEDAGKGLY